MKVFNKPAGVTKKFAAKAALYRRLCRKHGAGDKDFSVDALLELYAYESRGERVTGRGFVEMKFDNGYAFGKWLRDIDVAGYIEGIVRGDFCKAEFLGTALERLHNLPALRAVVAPIWFPFTKNLNDAQ